MWAELEAYYDSISRSHWTPSTLCHVQMVPVEAHEDYYADMVYIGSSAINDWQGEYIHSKKKLSKIRYFSNFRKNYLILDKKSNIILKYLKFS